MTTSPPTTSAVSHHHDGTPVRTLAAVLRTRAASSPDGIATIEPSGRTTWAQMDATANRVANALAADGVRAGDRVVFIGANSAVALEVLHGAARLGAIGVPVNSRLAVPEVAHILGDADPAVVVLGADEAHLLPATADLPHLARVVHLGQADGATPFADWIADVPATDPGHVADPDDTCVIFYTSGTTGLPKGIELTGDNLGQATGQMQRDLELDTTSVASAPVPFFHVAGFGLAMVATIDGAALLLEQATTPAALVDLLITRQVTHAVLVPTLLQVMVNMPETREQDWSRLRYVIYGAMPIPLPVLEAANEVLGCRFIQKYGLTETTGGGTVLGPDDHTPDPATSQRLRSAGRPMDGAEVRVVGPDSLEPLPVGERGEVAIRGGCVMKGYWRNPEETAKAVGPDGWLRTGDGGSFDQDGYLYLHDRLKDMIVTGGENVYPAEVESVMTGHPDLAEVAVIGVPSDRWGESPWAVVVPRTGTHPDPDQIIAWTRERLAHFKCPVGVTIQDALPRNATGKLLKRDLRDEHTTEPRPTRSTSERDA